MHNVLWTLGLGLGLSGDSKILAMTKGQDYQNYLLTHTNTLKKRAFSVWGVSDETVSNQPAEWNGSELCNPYPCKTPGPSVDKVVIDPMSKMTLGSAR